MDAASCPSEPAALASALRAILSKLRRRLREQADGGDLTPSQIAALLRLEREEPMTVSALARGEGVRSQSMGTIVAVLQAAGMVTEEPDPSDRRQTLLRVAPGRREWIQAGRAARQDWLTRRIARELTPAEQDELARTLTLLTRLVDD